MRAASSRALRAFLDDPARPAGTLTYFEVQGFLLAVASAPELIRPSEWLPVIFNEQGAGYASVEEAEAILGRLTVLYNEINAAVLEERATLPADCRLRRRPLNNLKSTAPVARWSRGFICGHQWLEDLWKVPLPDELDEEVGCGADDTQLLRLAGAGSRVSRRRTGRTFAGGSGRHDPRSLAGRGTPYAAPSFSSGSV